MLLRPFDYIKGYIKDKVERTRKLDEYIHTQFDSFVTWIIGFSFSGLLLIVSNLEKFALKSPTKPIIICLMIAILAGIFFRITSFLITIHQKSLDDYFFGLLCEDSVTPIFLEEDINNMEFHELLTIIKSDFGEDIYPGADPNVQLPLHLKAEEELKLREHYLNRIKMSRKEFDIAINHIAEIDYTAYRIDPKKTIERLKNPQEAFKKSKIGFNQRHWYLTRLFVYLLSLLSFLTAVCILSVSLLRYK